MRLSFVFGLIGLAACAKDEPLPICPYQVIDPGGWYYEVEISSEADMVESCFWDEWQEEWLCRYVRREYYGCYRIMKETRDVRLRIDGCETILPGYE